MSLCMKLQLLPGLKMRHSQVSSLQRSSTVLRRYQVQRDSPPLSPRMKECDCRLAQQEEDVGKQEAIINLRFLSSYGFQSHINLSSLSFWDGCKFLRFTCFYLLFVSFHHTGTLQSLMVYCMYVQISCVVRTVHTV